MTSFVADPQKLMGHHAVAIREYAQRVLVLGHTLAPDEEGDKGARMGEFLAIGSSLGLTFKEMVTLLYKEIFVTKHGCDCPYCRSRKDSL